MGRKGQLRQTTDVRVVLAESAPRAAEEPSLRAILEAEGFEILGEASDPAQLQYVLATTDPDVIVFDAGTAAATILAVRSRSPKAGVVVVWPPDVAAAGADQHVEPAKAASDLGDAVRRALKIQQPVEEPIVLPELTWPERSTPTGAGAGPARDASPGRGGPGRRRADLALGLAMLALVSVVVLAFMSLRPGKVEPVATSPGANPSPRASASAGPVPPLVGPTQVKASVVGSTTVVLTWAPGTGPTPTSFEIIRDRTQVAKIGQGATTWSDSGLSAGTTYTYVVRAVAGKMGISSPPVTVKTGVPALSAAALAGTWQVTYRVTSSSLVDAAPGQVATFRWAFVSACDGKRPCGGTWTIYPSNAATLTGTLRVNAGRFLGSMRDQPLGICGGAGIVASAETVIHPMKASMLAGRWAATRFQGVFSESFPAQNGCPASELTATITGTRTS